MLFICALNKSYLSMWHISCVISLQRNKVWLYGFSRRLVLKFIISAFVILPRVCSAFLQSSPKLGAERGPSPAVTWASTSVSSLYTALWLGPASSEVEYFSFLLRSRCFLTSGIVSSACELLRPVLFSVACGSSGSLFLKNVVWLSLMLVR